MTESRGGDQRRRGNQGRREGIKEKEKIRKEQNRLKEEDWKRKEENNTKKKIKEIFTFELIIILSDLRRASSFNDALEADCLKEKLKKKESNTTERKKRKTKPRTKRDGKIN